jgi:RNA polymerase sigma-70 factor, ECF subfamily
VQPLAPEARLIAESRNTYRSMSDLDLVRKANAGDSRALDALVERHAPRVQRLTAQLVGDLEDARDAAQESLVKLCTRLRQFRGEAQFGTWLHRLVVNTCRDLAARQRLRRTEPLDAEIGHDDDSDPSRLAALAEVRRELVEALSRLSVDQRAVVVLRDAAGLSYEEISRVARMPVGTAKSYVHRGRGPRRDRAAGPARNRGDHPPS